LHTNIKFVMGIKVLSCQRIDELNYDDVIDTVWCHVCIKNDIQSLI
jgi:hypothetical protein